MKKIFIVKRQFTKSILFLCLLCINSVHAYGELDTLCGPKCLLAICEYYSVKATLEEISNLSDYDKEFGTSMLGLYNAALKKGLPVVPMNMEFDRLCDINEHSIAFVKDNHFLIFHGCKNDYVTIQDPPGPPFTVTKKVFNKTWNGEILVFSKNLKKQMDLKIAKATVPPKGPYIAFAKTSHNFGTVKEGEKQVYTFSFNNIGTEPLNVTARSSCSCIAVLLSDKIIPPGGSGKVKVEFETNGKKGTTSQGAYVRTNDPENPMVKLTLSANVKSTVKAVPERLWLNEIAIREEIKREILVIDSGDKNLKIINIMTPDGVTAKILPEKNQSDIRSIPVQLTINSGSIPGNLEKTITILTNNLSRPEILVKIAGKVLSEIKAFPPSFFFGEIKPDTKVIREIILSSTNGTIFEIEDTVSSSKYFSTVIEPIEEGLKYKLVAVLHSSESGITIRNTIPIYIRGNDSPTLEIPIYAKVVNSQ